MHTFPCLQVIRMHFLLVYKGLECIFPFSTYKRLECIFPMSTRDKNGFFPCLQGIRMHLFPCLQGIRMRLRRSTREEHNTDV